MNLNSVVSGCVSAVNDAVDMIVQVSTGYTKDENYKQVPQYSPRLVTGQVQALNGDDLKQLAALNIQGVTQKVYLDGDFEGVFRVLGKGGDLIQFGGQVYLVNVVMERWADWVCLGITMQVDAAL